MLTRLRSPDAAARWLREWTTGSLRTDSRAVRPGDAFIAWPGHATDGRRFVPAALAAGAATCLVEADGVDALGFVDARIGTLPALKAATGPIAAAYFDRPSERLRVVATTGTNGKTSTAWWTAQALTLLGQRCGVVGTLGIGHPPVGDAPAAITATGLTTPDPVRLQAAFRQMLDDGDAACAIEASSIGVTEHRLTGTRIEVLLFTNFTQDHLDYHGSMAAYWAAKRLLFGWPDLKAASINVDDAQGAALAAELQGQGLDLWTYSLTQAGARLAAGGLGYVDGGLAFRVTERGSDNHSEGGATVDVQSRLIGDYNAANLLAVLGGLRALGVPLADAAAVVPQLTPVPGRMQRVPTGSESASGQPQVVVDYAHTPDALEKALAALRPFATARGGRLVCVFGCGGDRDPGKRPVMGGIAERLADRVVATSDNPRGEAPAAILAQIAAGWSRPAAGRSIEDRRAAIATAIAEADAADVLLIAGKGHEDYQEVGGTRLPFSDADEATQALARRAAAGGAQ